MNFFKKSLLVKLLTLIVCVAVVGGIILITLAIKHEENGLFYEKVQASKLMSAPIVHSLFRDMLDERADLARHLIQGMIAQGHTVRTQVVRGNGVEQAFHDFKTLREVEVAYKKDRDEELPPEWTEDHPDEAVNVADGVDHPRFKEALALFKGGRKEAIHYTEEVEGKRVLTYLTPLHKQKKCYACHTQEEVIRGVLMISTSLEEMYARLAVSRRNWVLYGFSILLGTCATLSLMVKGIVTGPMRQTADILVDISDKGDLTKRLHVRSSDEVGVMGRCVNQFIEAMQGIIKNILASSRLVTTISSSIEYSSKGFQSAARDELQAVEETSSSIVEMDASLGAVKSNVEGLLSSTQGAFTASQEMSAAVTEIAGSAETLDLSVNQTAGAITRIVSFHKENVSHISGLHGEIERVGAVTAEMNSAIRKVEGLSKEQAHLAEKVVAIVTTHQGSVDQSKQAIEKMVGNVNETSSIMKSLGEKSKTIGSIVDVINEVAEATNLLSLNAAILAAQAGEHGKGFAIVADEVKGLSQRTTASTKEIAEFIEQIQKDVASAVSSVEETSSTLIDVTLKLSRDAEEALTTIKDSTNETLDMSKMVERATAEQASAVHHVAESIDRIDQSVAEIKNATESQYQASEAIALETEHMKEATRKVKQSTSDQSRQGRHIYEVLKDISEKMQSITYSMREHKIASERVVKAIEVIRKNTEENVSRAAELDRNAHELNTHSASLKDKVDRFNV